MPGRTPVLSTFSNIQEANIQVSVLIYMWCIIHILLHHSHEKCMHLTNAPPTVSTAQILFQFPKFRLSTHCIWWLCFYKAFPGTTENQHFCNYLKTLMLLTLIWIKSYTSFYYYCIWAPSLRVLNVPWLSLVFARNPTLRIKYQARQLLTE